MSLQVIDVRSGSSNPDFLLGGRTSASAECRHWSGRAVRWSSCAILLRSSARVDFYFVPATDCASASLHWSLTLPILFRMQLRSLPGQLSFTSVVQALLISATRASLALHASENSAACVFTQSLMRPPPGLTSAHFALMSAAQAPIDRSFAIATGAERSTTAPITMILFIIGHSPKRKKMRMLTHGQREMCPDQPALYGRR